MTGVAAIVGLVVISPARAAVVVSSSMEFADRGEEANLVFSLDGSEGNVATYEADVSFDSANIDIASSCDGGGNQGMPCESNAGCPGGLCVADCAAAARLTQQVGQFTRPAAGELILFVGDTQFPVDTMDDGAMLTCTFRVRDTAPDGVYPLPTTFLEVGDSDAVVLDAQAIDGSITVCDTVEAAQIEFSFSVDPPSPIVGDDVEVTVDVSNTSSGTAGLPAYTLSGASPFLQGDMTAAANVSSLGSDTATFQLQAVQAGTANLVFSVSYESAFGCAADPVFFFTSSSSDPFPLQIGAGPGGPTPTPTVPGGGDLPTATPTSMEGGSSGSKSSGCSLGSPGSEGFPGAGFLLLPLLVLALRRRRCV